MEGFGGPVELGEVGGIVTGANGPEAGRGTYECDRCQMYFTAYQLRKTAQGEALDHGSSPGHIRYH